MTYYRRAIELEPGYAEPYSGLALAYCLDFQNHWADTPDALGVAAHFAAQAIDKGPDEPYAQYAAAVVLTWRRDLAGALAAADRALALNPNYALAGHLARLPFQNAAGLDRIRDGLAKAGLSG